MATNVSDTTILKLLESSNRDVEWFCSKYENLRKDNPDKFVAIDDQRVVEVSTTLNKLLVSLKKKKIDPSLVLVEFLPKEDVISIL